MECLAIHRSITKKQIYQSLNSKQKLIEEKLAGKIFKYPAFVRNQVDFHYAITPANIKRVIDRYTLSKNYIRNELKKFEDNDYDRIVKKYLEFLSRLVIIKTDCVDGSKYELSLFGVSLILAIVTHPHQKMFYRDNGLEKNNQDLVEFYRVVSQNYADKLPLVFGKWALLTNTWDYAHQWFLPVLYQNLEDEFTRSMRPGSVSVTLGGVKEYQETMQEIAFHTTARLFEVYLGLSTFLHQGDQKREPDQNGSSISKIRDAQQAGLLALEQIQKELAALLKYADLRRFVQELKDDMNLTQVEQHLKTGNSELSIIEKVLAREITFLFYINLARNRFLDYTDEGRNFLGDERDTNYQDTSKTHILKPIDFLRIILKADRELKDTFLGWMANIMDYRLRSAKHMEQFENIVKKWKRRVELIKNKS